MAIKRFEDGYGYADIDISTGKVIEISKGETPQGFCYKSEEAWRQGFCGYLAESSEEYSEKLDRDEMYREDFFRYAKELIGKEYPHLEYTDEMVYEMVDNVFDVCDWQYLSTRLTEELDNAEN